MIGKFALIALVCVSVAQVQGGDLQNDIKNGLKRAKALNEKGQRRFEDATNGAYWTIHLMDHTTYEYQQKAQRLQESTIASVARVATIVERQASKANRPESVFECIRSNEEEALKEIKETTRRFGWGLSNLRGRNAAKAFTATTDFEKLASELNAEYAKVSNNINNCHDRKCVNTLLEGFSSFLNYVFASVRRVESQIATFYDDFDRYSNKYLSTNVVQVNRIKSAGIRFIIRCYFSGERNFVDSE